VAFLTVHFYDVLATSSLRDHANHPVTRFR